MFTPPDSGINHLILDQDSIQRREAMIESFGKMLLSLSQQCIARIQLLCTSEDARSGIGRIERAQYEKAANLDTNTLSTALEIAELSINTSTRLFLSYLAQSGHEIHCGEDHYIAFRLYMDVIDGTTGEIIINELINRNGEKALPDYWGRWLNRFGAQK